MNNFLPGCNLCNDTGFIIEEDGARPCPHHRTQGLQEAQKKQDTFLTSLTLGLPRRFNNLSLNDWEENLQSTKAGKVMSRKLLSVIDTTLDTLKHHSSKKTMGIFLYGEPGIGKTYALATLYMECLRARVGRAAFLNYPRFLGQSKRLFSDPYKRNHLQSILYRVPILILDDIGSEQAKENPDYSWAQDELYQIIDYRHDEYLFTCFSTNISIRELEDRFKKQLLSRILGMTHAYHCHGDDLRPHLVKSARKNRVF